MLKFSRDELPPKPSLDELAAHYAKIEQDNEAFRAMTPEQKRVQIAKDVLDQIALNRIIGASTYFSDWDTEAVAKNSEWQSGNKGSELEVRDLFKKMPQCEVCGIGSLFVATVDRLNEFKVKNMLGYIDSRQAQVDYLAKNGIFTSQHLKEIEEAFEGYHGTRQTDHLKKVMLRIIDTCGVMERDMFDGIY